MNQLAESSLIFYNNPHSIPLMTRMYEKPTLLIPKQLRSAKKCRFQFQLNKHKKINLFSTTKCNKLRQINIKSYSPFFVIERDFFHGIENG